MSDEQKILFEIYLENNEFKVKAKEAADGLGKVGDSAQKSSGMFDKLKSSWVGTTLAVGAMYMAFKKVVGIYSDTVKEASNLQETTNKFDVVFGSCKDKAESFAKTLVDSYGMTRQESKAFLSGTGDILQGLGMQADKALELSNSVATLGTDLASFSNVEGGAERAINALSTALTGEREALKAYGIVINEDMITAQLQAEGKSKLTGLALTQAKAEATIALAYKQSGNAIGDMARSYDSYANIQRRVESRTKDISSSIGEELLPSLSNLGIAFLETSKDGGIISDAFKTITKFIAGTINGVSLLIVKLDQMRATSATEELTKAAQIENQIYQQRLKRQQTLTFGQMSFNDAVKAGIPEAVRVAEETEKTRLRAIEKYKVAIAGADKEREKIDALAKLQKRINADEANDTAQAVSKREKDKKNQSTQSGKPTTKAKEANVDSFWKATGNELKGRENQYNDDIVNAKLAYTQGKVAKEDYEKGLLDITKKYEADRLDIQLKSVDKIFSAYQQMGSGLTQLSGGFSEIVSMNASNQTAEVENAAQSQLDAITAKYEAETLAINNSTASETEKAAKLKTLDEKRAREEKAINDKAAKDKRKIAREAAEMQKKISYFETSVNIPTAAFMAWNSAMALPAPASFIVGAAMATASTALGLAKLKMINEEPLPSYAIGSWAIPYDQTAQIHKGEMIIPKTFADSVRSGEGAIGAGSVINNYYFAGSYYDSAGLLEAVDDAQERRARNMGATKYTIRSAY